MGGISPANQYADNYIVATGDIYGGMQFFGPFADFYSALDWATAVGEQYTIVPLEPIK